MTSILVGVIGYAIYQPYSALVGCSPGVYGVIGCALSMALNQRKSMNPGFHFIFTFSLFAQLIADSISYVYSYDAGTGYSAHLFGYVCGFLLGMSTYLTFKDNARLFVGCFCWLLFLIEAGFVSYEYSSNWPPKVKDSIDVKGQICFQR